MFFIIFLSQTKFGSVLFNCSYNLIWNSVGFMHFSMFDTFLKYKKKRKEKYNSCVPRKKVSLNNTADYDCDELKNFF